MAAGARVGRRLADIEDGFRAFAGLARIRVRVRVRVRGRARARIRVRRAAEVAVRVRVRVRVGALPPRSFYGELESDHDLLRSVLADRASIAEELRFARCLSEEGVRARALAQHIFVADCGADRSRSEDILGEEEEAEEAEEEAEEEESRKEGRKEELLAMATEDESPNYTETQRERERERERRGRRDLT
jgi:hypothetical protein